jgi:type II secretory ATPase GspE/PulE/Tfp pilus assembly ATPase PilB-like protein
MFNIFKKNENHTEGNKQEDNSYKEQRKPFGSSQSEISQESRNGIGKNLIKRSSINNDIIEVSDNARQIIKSQVQIDTDATEKEIQEYLDFKGEVYTASSSNLKTTDAQRTYGCFLSDGTLLIAKNAVNHTYVGEIRQAIRRAGKHVKVEKTVDMKIIKQIHEEYDRRNGLLFKKTSRGLGENIQQMQHEFLKLVREAAEKKASDIHISINKKHAIIQLRAGGIIQFLRQEQSSWTEELCVAAFNMSDVSESSYKPNEFQDARISSQKTPLSNNVDAIRLHFNPLANGGRHLVARLLYKTDPEDMEKDIDTLGYANIHVKLIKKMRKFPVGINIVSGPTGSGKSTTLQKCLIALMKEHQNRIKVLTIEDPPEYEIPGAEQIPVMKGADDDQKKKMAYTLAIAAALRSDPDVIMIGEIRTDASAGLAFEAAMTGHQVWASLHANDAVSCLDRLGDMSVDLYKLTDHTLVTGLIAQRLVRSVCPHCCFTLEEAVSNNLVDDDLLETIKNIAGEKYIKNIRFENPEGCHKCKKTGSLGREVVAEALIPNSKFMSFMRERKKEEAVNYWIEQMNGFRMLEHAVQKMLLGYCSPIAVEARMGSLEDFDIKRLDTIMGDNFCNLQVMENHNNKE